MSQPRNAQTALTAMASAIAIAFTVAPRVEADRVTSLDASARAGGMGGAAVAVPWGGTPDLWLNPALVAVPSGVSVRMTSAQLYSGDLDNTWHRSAWLSAAWAGVGVASSGRPFGGTDLEHRPLVNGRAVPWSYAYPFFSEQLASYSFAVSAAGLADAVLALVSPGSPVVADWADVGWGRSWKRVLTREDLLPDAWMHARDEGWFVRAVPVGARRSEAGPGNGVRVELAVGASTLNHRPSGGPGGDLRQSRRGAAARVEWGQGASDARGTPWLAGFPRSLAPRVGLTLTMDQEQQTGVTDYTLPRPPGRPSDYEANHYGLEATVFGVLTGRFGYTDCDSGRVRRSTWGGGVCVPLGSAGDVRFEFARWPLASSRWVWRHEIAVRIDPIRRRPGTRRN